MNTFKLYYLALDNAGIKPIFRPENQSMFDLLNECIEKYGLHVIDVYDDEIEAFRAYLITKEVGLDNL